MFLSMNDFLPRCLFAVVVIICFMIGVNVWWVYQAPQNIPPAISVLILGNKVVLFFIHHLLVSFHRPLSLFPASTVCCTPSSSHSWISWRLQNTEVWGAVFAIVLGHSAHHEQPPYATATFVTPTTKSKAMVSMSRKVCMNGSYRRTPSQDLTWPVFSHTLDRCPAFL